MIFTRIYLDNLFSFRDCEIDLSITRKLANSTVAHEYLADYKNFNFRRVCIISGSNAGGKTAFGRVLCAVQNVLFGRMFNHFLEMLSDKKKNANIEVEFVAFNEQKQAEFYAFQISISPNLNTPKLTMKSILLRKNDTVLQARKRLEQAKFYDENQLKEKLQPNSWNVGWLYLFANTAHEEVDRTCGLGANLDLNVLRAILADMDSSILKVDAVRDENNAIQGYKINFANGDGIVLDLKGYATQPDRLSKGTYDGIQVACMLSEMSSECTAKGNTYTYFLDEKMSFIHSELECSILNVMIEKLPQHAQFFYTTHNYDTLRMTLPNHSYLFISKGKDGYTNIVQPEKYIKKNDRSLICFLQNDVFNIAPNTSNIESLL